MSEYDHPEPPRHVISIRAETYRALQRVRLDTSDTFDMVIQDALKRRYPWLDI